MMIQEDDKGRAIVYLTGSQLKKLASLGNRIKDGQDDEWIGLQVQQIHGDGTITVKAVGFWDESDDENTTIEL